MNASNIAAYLDRRLTDPDREKAEAHLVACESCRADLIATRATMTKLSRPRKFAAVGGLVAAATVLILLPVARENDVPQYRSQPVRESTASSLVAYGPLGEKDTEGLRFVWGAISDVAGYRLTVFAKEGVPLWSYNGNDTSVALPDSVRLDIHRNYYWMADALLLSGSTRSTGMREFRPVHGR